MKRNCHWNDGFGEPFKDYLTAVAAALVQAMEKWTLRSDKSSEPEIQQTCERTYLTNFCTMPPESSGCESHLKFQTVRERKGGGMSTKTSACTTRVDE
eukprot:5434044-Amphidinium_carterae.3